MRELLTTAVRVGGVTHLVGPVTMVLQGGPRYDCLAYVRSCDASYLDFSLFTNTFPQTVFLNSFSFSTWLKCYTQYQVLLVCLAHYVKLQNKTNIKTTGN